MTRPGTIALWATLGLAGVAGAEPEAGGEHLRLQTPTGVVHLWWPADYRPETAGVVVYVHGYFSTADTAWSEHRLAEQFARSHENALFVAPEAPAGERDPVVWESLEALLAAVAQVRPLPPGPLVAIGHSGGFRTILPWLSDKRLRLLLLLDGLYGPERPFHAWLRGGPRAPNRRQLVVVASETARKAERFARRYRGAARRGSVPDDASQFTSKERAAPVLVMRSQYEHNEIVTSGRVIPLVLQLSRLEPIAAPD